MKAMLGEKKNVWHHDGPITLSLRVDWLWAYLNRIITQVDVYFNPPPPFSFFFLLTTTFSF